MIAKRVTPMLVSEDVDASAASFLRFGFKRRDTEETGCIGLVSGDGTGVMLLSDDYVRRSMPASATALAGDGGLYIWVDDLDRANVFGETLAEATTEYGTRELFVNQQGRLVIYTKLEKERVNGTT